jgi:hypothetical protein
MLPRGFLQILCNLISIYRLYLYHRDYERVGEMQQQGDDEENEDNKYDVRTKIKNVRYTMVIFV